MFWLTSRLRELEKLEVPIFAGITRNVANISDETGMRFVRHECERRHFYDVAHIFSIVLLRRACNVEGCISNDSVYK